MDVIEVIDQGEQILENQTIEYVQVTVDILKDFIFYDVEQTGDINPLIEKYTIYCENREIYEKGLLMIEKHSEYNKQVKSFVKETIDLISLICSEDKTESEED